MLLLVLENWNKVVNVSKEEKAAEQIAIINKFPAEKRMKISLNFANLSVDRTRKWISKNHPIYSKEYRS